MSMPPAEPVVDAPLRKDMDPESAEFALPVNTEMLRLEAPELIPSAEVNEKPPLVDVADAPDCITTEPPVVPEEVPAVSLTCPPGAVLRLPAAEPAVKTIYPPEFTFPDESPAFRSTLPALPAAAPVASVKFPLMPELEDPDAILIAPVAPNVEEPVVRCKIPLSPSTELPEDTVTLPLAVCWLGPEMTETLPPVLDTLLPAEIATLPPLFVASPAEMTTSPPSVVAELPLFTWIRPEFPAADAPV